MAKRIRRVRTFARTAPKSQEKNLINNAKKIRENPYQILPDTTDSNCGKYLSKYKKQIEKIHKYKDDATKLEKLTNKKGIQGALAGTLLLAISEKAPYLGVLKFPTGDITYAQRGRADKEKLIAIQYYDHPVLRLLGMKDLAYKKNLHIYSWENNYICTGTSPQPPKDFQQFIIKTLDLNQKNNVCSCPHLTNYNIKAKQPAEDYYLHLHWKSANIFFAICKTCAKTSKNTLFSITKYMVLPSITDNFDISIVAQVIKGHEQSTQAETSYIDEYLAGKISDYELITKNVRSRKKSLEESDEKIYVLDGISYGTDTQRFIEKLNPKPHQQDALEYILERITEPLIVNETSAAKIIGQYWEEYGKDYLTSIISDQKTAESFYKLDEKPSQILEIAHDFQKRQQILAKLPSYQSLQPLAEFADTIAKTYKTFGKKKTLSELAHPPTSSKAKSVAYAFLLSLEKGIEQKWKFSKEQIEYGEYLKEFTKKLLEAEPESYREALQNLLQASGSNEQLPQK